MDFVRRANTRTIKPMKALQSIQKKIEKYQMSHSWVGFPAAVIKRYGDEEVGKQAALITYYGFLSLFPLMLAFLTIIGMMAIGDPELKAKIIEQAFQYFPALGEDLQENVQTVQASGIALAIQLLVLLYGARGVAVTMRDAFNYVWHNDRDHKSNFLVDNLRSFAMIFAVGIGVTIGTIISYFLAKIIDINTTGTILITLVNWVVTMALFLAVFRLGTSSRIKTNDLILGAIIAGTGLLIIQQLGANIMAHYLPRLQGTYGSFALTLGMLFWIYLQAQVIMYALVTTAVSAQKDWPKTMFDGKK